MSTVTFCGMGSRGILSPAPAPTPTPAPIPTRTHNRTRSKSSKSTSTSRSRIAGQVASLSTLVSQLDIETNRLHAFAAIEGGDPGLGPARKLVNQCGVRVGPGDSLNPADADVARESVEGPGRCTSNRARLRVAWLPSCDIFVGDGDRRHRTKSEIRKHT